jgi:hypothetical protein
MDAWKTMGFGVGNVMAGEVIGLDEDVPGGMDKWFAELDEPIPLTLTDVVPLTHKRHFHFLRHPAVTGELAGDFRLEDGTVIGEVARDGARQFVSPGAVWRGGDQYALREWNRVDVVATLSENATRRLLSHQSNGVAYTPRPEQEGEWQWDESMGSRHNLIVKEARKQAGSIRDSELLFAVVWDFASRHGLVGRHPGTQRDVDVQEVRDACDSALRKYDEDPEPIHLNVPRMEGNLVVLPPPVIVTTDLFIPVSDYIAAQPTTVEWVSPLAAYGFVSLIAGPPKGGKSTLVAGLLRAREVGGVYLWGDPVPTGPMALVTEEGGLAVVRKVAGLTKLDILDRRNFIAQGLRKLEHLLDALTDWCAHQAGRALVNIDTLAIWGDIKDENDATAATQAVATMTLFAQQTQSAVALVHHGRKGGGEHGEGIRGSGAIFATVDQAIELNYVTDKTSDNRLLSLSGRLIFPELHELSFDRDTNAYAETTSTYVSPYPIDKFPTSTSGQPGLQRKDAEAIWGVGQSVANEQLKDHVTAGRLVKTMVKDGRNWAGEYHRVVRLDLSADARSVGERMATIYEAVDATDAAAPIGEPVASVASDPKAVGGPTSGEEPDGSGT